MFDFALAWRGWELIQPFLGIVHVRTGRGLGLLRDCLPRDADLTGEQICTGPHGPSKMH